MTFTVFEQGMIALFQRDGSRPSNGELESLRSVWGGLDKVAGMVANAGDPPWPQDMAREIAESMSYRVDFIRAIGHLQRSSFPGPLAYRDYTSAHEWVQRFNELWRELNATADVEKQMDLLMLLAQMELWWLSRHMLSVDEAAGPRPVGPGG